MPLPQYKSNCSVNVLEANEVNFSCSSLQLCEITASTSTGEESLSNSEESSGLKCTSTVELLNVHLQKPYFVFCSKPFYIFFCNSENIRLIVYIFGINLL